MTLAETRLDMAVRVAVRALRASPDATPADRLAAFGAAYASVERLEAGGDDWSAQVLEAAWALVADAFPRGGEPAELADALARAHAGLVAVAAPPPDRRDRDRRDA